MQNNPKFCNIVTIIFSFIFLFGCAPESKEEIPQIGDIKEGDIQTETYIVDGKEYKTTYKVYDLAEGDEEPVLVMLPLEYGDRTVDEIDGFKDQTSSSAAEIKDLSYKYFLSVPELVDLAKGKSSQKRSQINTSFDDLNELEGILNEFQEFGEDGVYTLSLILEGMDLSLKEFMSAGEEVFGDEYMDWIKENPKSLDQLYTDYILSGKETYEDFLEDGGKRSAVALEIGAEVVFQAIFEIVKAANSVPSATLDGKEVAYINKKVALEVEKLAPQYRSSHILNRYYGMRTATLPSGYSATGISYYFNVDYAYQAKSREGLPGKYWIPKVKIYSTAVNAIGLCPIYAYYVPFVKVKYNAAKFLNKNTDNILPEVEFEIAVNCYMRIGLCIGKVNKSRKFKYKISGKDGCRLVGVYMYTPKK